MQSFLKFIYSDKNMNQRNTQKIFPAPGFFFISNVFRGGIALIQYIIENFNFHEMNIL